MANTTSKPKLTLTRPKEPDLETSHRARSVRVKSSVELEEEMMANTPKFKARPVNKKMLEASTLPRIACSTPQPPEFQEFHLKTTERENQIVETSSIESSYRAKFYNDLLMQDGPSWGRSRFQRSLKAHHLLGDLGLKRSVGGVMIGSGLGRLCRGIGGPALGMMQPQISRPPIPNITAPPMNYPRPHPGQMPPSYPGQQPQDGKRTATTYVLTGGPHGPFQMPPPRFGQRPMPPPRQMMRGPPPPLGPCYSGEDDVAIARAILLVGMVSSGSGLFSVDVIVLDEVHSLPLVAF
ncbi:hypothetical protein IFM89_013468 [Coptis chinensis]|uniref:TPX2 central domain-containing protein n=1 Tax=Coptis chinensis TaxID=261450 RepID=A0A835HM59_9MAGN|nr:hypothetical protein IFM89_013468 [Coptis chinensis]